jgi:hypothetical protein
MQITKRPVKPRHEYVLVLSQEEAAMLRSITGCNYTTADNVDELVEYDRGAIADFLDSIYQGLETEDE